MVNIKIRGMHCASCEMLVKDSLEELDGVNKVEASHEKGIVSVDFDENKVDKSKIVETIKSEGYNVE